MVGPTNGRRTRNVTRPQQRHPELARGPRCDRSSHKTTGWKIRGSGLPAQLNTNGWFGGFLVRKAYLGMTERGWLARRTDTAPAPHPPPTTSPRACEGSLLRSFLAQNDGLEDPGFRPPRAVELQRLVRGIPRSQSLPRNDGEGMVGPTNGRRIYHSTPSSFPPGPAPLSVGALAPRTHHLTPFISTQPRAIIQPCPPSLICGSG